ncbi:MAG: circularly permuted type 2 ATP-grasp protein [Labilithrix sp.]|nr:circularly permuted type 2 ATP-grasp protein [Labilithrix sp.]MCW5815832.1 circularly permuted type 2 ATP-grasp protein [Labilithrix sp.]
MTQGILSSYVPPASRYDEMVDGGLRPRPHWQALLSHLGALPSDTLQERKQFVQDAIASDGVSYNVYADPKGGSRPWELDLLPLILPSEEWSVIATAVAQRARLLNAVLNDLYGPQTLLADGLLPPALVFGQRSFLWPAIGIAPKDGVAMHLYAADLARAPDGRWWILADRTGGPSGAGYALQNRMTISRALPDAFRDLHIEPLAPFFSALQDTLYRGARQETGEAPLAVLLTPGPFNETYFEHSFLARYLGFPLVEGQDLIVRGDMVYLKTLRGLKRVHAILRRLDGDYCDPVELRPDSAIGIPGLMHVIRAGNVLVANSLGANILESGALSGFYPAISERLFGERLAMPGIATWWCGEGPALEYAIKNLEHLVIKPAYPTIRMEPIFGHTLDAAARERLVDRMQGQPHAYVAQEHVQLSHAPTLGRTQAEAALARPASLRVYAVATPNGYLVMPGALTRVAPSDGGDVVSMQWGGSSKDTWILADKPVVRVPLRRPRLGAEDVVQSSVDIASRVGENLFWMGRYAERCEAVARLLRAALVRVADASPPSQPALRTLGATALRLEVLPAPDSGDDVTAPPSIDLARDFLAAAIDPSVPGGLVANVLRLHGSGNQVRERMSTDNWHVLSRCVARLPKRDAPLGAALDSLDEVMMTCVSLAGFAMDDMTRDESWQFLPLGRRLERLVHLSRMIASVLNLSAQERADSLEWLLEAANSIVTFRARYRRAPELLPVLHLIVLDETNPHAIAFQLRDLAITLVRTHAQLGGDMSGDDLGGLIAALRNLPLSGFEPEKGEELEKACKHLASILERAERMAYAISDALQRRFFSHTGTQPIGIGEKAK